MLEKIIIVFGVLTAVNGQCTSWQSMFADSTWVDNTRDNMVFSTTTMSGWTITMRSQTFNQWECVDSSNTGYIVMKATNQLTYSSLSFYVYACLQLTKITDNSYYYYQQNIQESNAGYERLKFSTSNTLASVSEICDTTVTVPSQEFHVMIKSGTESSAAIECPTQFLYTADYVYNDTSTYACADSQDVWDVCTSTSEMTFNYSTCSQTIAYSAGGKLWCVANVGQCVVLYNQDSALISTTRQFSCLCSDGTSVAVVENNCTATQTPGVIPTGPDGVSAIGYLVTVGTKYVDCAPVDATSSSSSSGGGGTSIGLIVGIVIGLLVVIAVVIIIICVIRHKKKKGKNKVTESTRPILLDKESARVDAVNETSRASPSKRSARERTSLSREGSRLNKSMVDGRASVTSIGLEQKSERPLSREKTSSPRKSTDRPLSRENTASPRKLTKGLDREKSNVTLISVKAANVAGDKDSKNDSKTDKENPVKALLAHLPCWPKDKEPEAPKESEPEPPETTTAVVKKGAAKKGAKKGAAKGSKEPKGGKGKGKKGGKGGKEPDGDKKAGKGEKESEGDKKAGKGEKESEGNKKAGKGEKEPEGDKNAKQGKGEKPDKTDKAAKSDDLVLTDVESEPHKPKMGGPQFTSTPIPKDGKQKSFVSAGKMPTFISMPSSLHKPEDKKTGWPFLVCCAGASEPVKVDTPPPPEPEPVEPPKKKGKAKGKGGTKGKGKPAAKGKAGGDKGKKKVGKADKVPDEPKPGDGEGEIGQLERALTMPERVREKTALSLTEAEKVKVDVYVPNEETQLQLKDTVTLMKGKNGEVPMEKSKTTLGLARPQSSVSKADSKVNASKPKEKTEKDSKKEKKGKDKEKGGKDKEKGGKDKKGGAKKKKK